MPSASESRYTSNRLRFGDWGSKRRRTLRSVDQFLGGAYAYDERMNIREWLRRGGTSPDWVWRLFKLWECNGCHTRFRDRNKLFSHELQCPDDRAFNGQG